MLLFPFFHFKHTSFKMPDLQDSKLTNLCHHFSADGWTGFAGIEATKRPRETISQTLLHSIQGFINYLWVVQWQVIFIHFEQKGRLTMLNFTWALCSQKAELAKKFPYTFVLWNSSSLLCSKKQLPAMLSHVLKEDPSLSFFVTLVRLWMTRLLTCLY